MIFMFKSMKNKPVKIVFIIPRSAHMWESLGVGYLASYSYKFGFSPEQYKFYTQEFDTEYEILAGCEDADYIGFSLTSFQVNQALMLIRKIKKINSTAKIIWGGYGVDGFPAENLIAMYGDYVDYFVQGPGEQAWVRILTDPNSPRVMRSPIITDFDKYPYPDRDLIRIDRNLKKLMKLEGVRKTSMEMQRGGCPFKCKFCAAGSFQNKRGWRSAGNIIGEMEILRDKYGMDKDSVVLMSDAEILIDEQIVKMAEMKVERNIDFKFGMNVVASTITQPEKIKCLEKLAKAGCSELWMGVESDPTLMHLTGKPISPEEIKKAFKITKELGFIRKAYFILGFTEEETEQTILNRIPFIEEIDPDVVGFTIYIPVPGSPGYDHDKHGDIDFENSCEYQNLFTRTKTLSNSDLHYWQKYLVDYFKDKSTYRQKEDASGKIYFGDKK